MRRFLQKIIFSCYLMWLIGAVFLIPLTSIFLFILYPCLKAAAAWVKGMQEVWKDALHIDINLSYNTYLSKKKEIKTNSTSF